MPEKVPVISRNTFPKRDLLLKLIADRLAKLRNDRNFGSDNERYLYTRITAVAYLKETGQYRRQLQGCLKNFSGRTAETFRPEFVSAVRTLYRDHLLNLGRSVIEFSEQKVNRRKILDLDFSGAEISNPHFSGILESLFNEYGEVVLNLDYAPWTCRMARIYNCSKDTMNRLEGKLRIIGQFGCLDEAISFLEVRIGLHGKYTFKVLVDNLDELINDFLIDSSNGLVNNVKAQQPLDELVKEAAGKYEILNAPTYLVNPAAYKSILKHRIKATLKKGSFNFPRSGQNL
ncbi:hypothetical protein NC796_04680 [Aliifodinibius sp. S!AR15-10]|uniref:hypothetical protein n=1 Tax=Aliifodinibius sp. S!AR15-10 TaxID=2950437 RepID=UPI0028563611|nr:hypothetical protein [Aliifodinibius sp. S!AR15-10]MDR8390426.1 hypothetical protein [Aliifodinibius sp. S!AR15-10]